MPASSTPTMPRALVTGRPQDAHRSRERRGPRRDDARSRIPLTDEGFPAAVPDAPTPSPVVSVAAESRATYPWLPARVIAGSVWHGPEHVRVQVDAGGRATRWPSRAPARAGRGTDATASSPPGRSSGKRPSTAPSST